MNILKRVGYRDIKGIIGNRTTPGAAKCSIFSGGLVDNNRRQSQRSTPLVAADLGRESHENLVPRGL